MNPDLNSSLRPIYRRPAQQPPPGDENNYRPRPLTKIDILRRCLLVIFLLILFAGLAFITWDKFRH
jgi:hypothetical protein